MIDSIADTAKHMMPVIERFIITDTISAKEKLNIVAQNIPKVLDGVVHFCISIVVAIIILVVGFWAVKVFVNMLDRALKRNKVDDEVRIFLKSLVRIILKIVVVLAAVAKLGVATSSVVALFGAAGLGVGMALSGTLQNFAGGIILLIFRPFKIGDYIESGGNSGTVLAIQIFMTIMKTSDNKVLYIPNSSLISAPLVNYNKANLRRVDIDFGVAYGTDLQKAKKIIEDVANADNGVLKQPKTQTVVAALADSSVVISCRMWARTEEYWEVKWRINESVYNALSTNGIKIPYPHMQVHISKEQ